MFFLTFLLDDGRVQIRIHIQIREAQKHTDTDPQHCCKVLIEMLAYITSELLED
jgi:hypothetical protein